MYKTITFIFIITTILSSFGQEPTKDKYNAGFTSIHLIDSSRTFKPNTELTDKLHYRPLDIDIWYPSNETAEKSMLFGELFKLHEERAKRYEEEDYDGFTEELAMFLAAGFGLEPDKGKELLKLETETQKGIEPANADFPLIIYMAGFNGMGWENFHMLEKLAKNGFVVVSISSVGRYPGNMSNDLQDTMEQVYDGDFALKELKKSDEFSIDFSNVGILGMSWGGMSGAILLDKHPDIKAFASLDGTDVFYFGDTEEDDKFLTEIYDADLLHPNKINAAYLYFESGNKLEEFKPTDEYHYFKKLSSNKKYLRYTKSEHEDFGSLAWALKASEERVQIHEEVTRSTTLFFQKYLKSDTGFEQYFEHLIEKEDTTDQPFEYNAETPKELLLSGSAEDSKTHEILPYVNIGVLNKDWGTVSNKDGVFQLELNENFKSDTLRISMVGYKPQTILVKTLMNRKGEFKIKMDEDVSELNEVVVTAKKWKFKTIGNKTKSKFLGAGFAYDMLGAELGVRINVRKKPTYVNAFNFNISYNRLSAKAIFRLNIYKVKNGKPDDNIITESILIPIESGQTGLISTDLKKYNIVLTDDVIVMLEWIEAEGEIKTGQGILLSVGMFTGGTYNRKSSQGKLKKFRGLGLGYNLDVKY